MTIYVSIAITQWYGMYHNVVILGLFNIPQCNTLKTINYNDNKGLLGPSWRKKSLGVFGAMKNYIQDQKGCFALYSKLSMQG